MAKQSNSLSLPMVPPSFFGIVLGLAGLGGNWRIGHAAWGLPAVAGESIYLAAGVSWLILTVLYSLKWLKAADSAREEAAHPVQCCFIGLVGVATMLVAAGALPYSRPLAVTLYAAGALFTILFGLWRTGLLWRGGRNAETTTPVLYLPLVAGGFVTGIGAAALGWLEIAQLAFGVGFFTWLAVESVLLHRLYTEGPLPKPLRPTLGIQLAPPAVGASCYLAVSGARSDLVAHMLIGYALVQGLLLVRKLPWIMEQPFGASYWAFTFGATALASASARMAIDAPNGIFAWLAPVLFVAANVVVLAIAVGTIVQMCTGKLLPKPAPAVAAGAGAGSPPAQQA